MGPEENIGQQPAANDLELLRLRIDRLEREVDLLRQRGVPVASEPLHAAPPPPFIAAQATSVTHEETAAFEPLVAVLPPRVSPPKASLENRLGSQVFNWIGIIAIFIAAAWGLQLAIQNNWIGPLGRVIIGLVAGIGIVVWSEIFRRKNMAAFSYSLKAVGSGVLYLSVWAAFQIYHLLPASVALVAMVLVTAWNAYMAWSQDAELLAAYALVGGFATPMLLSTGTNHEIFFFTYLLAINLATAALIRVKQWARLLFGTFPATVVFYAGWYLSSFDSSERIVTAIFLLLFGLTFVSISIGKPALADISVPGRNPLAALISDIFLPLLNAAFVAFGFYLILRDSHDHAALPFLMVLLAAAYLILMRLPQSRVASAVHLSLAVVFLTIAVPLKASGHWITVAWLVEGVALYWVSTRLASSEPSTKLRSDTVLRWLAWTALLLGFVAIFFSTYWFGSSLPAVFFNHDFATALIGIVSFASVAWLAYRKKPSVNPEAAMTFALIAVNIIAVLLALRELTASHATGSGRAAFFNADFATALVGIVVLAAVAYVELRIGCTYPRQRNWPRLAGASIVAMNLVAILSGVQEIIALWSYSRANPSDDFKQALAVSAFLMLYSALLLAVGFWKRTSFIRWQGLILLVFTIAKTFLYDMSSLSQGYRVVSFLGLGVLLMGVSFAYQKDWLSLREPSATPSPTAEEQS